MSDTVCPICEAEADGGDQVGDTTLFICLECGGYRLARSALTEFQNSSRTPPTQSPFAKLVAQRRKELGKEYPVITTYDLDGPMETG